MSGGVSKQLSRGRGSADELTLQPACGGAHSGVLECRRRLEQASLVMPAQRTAGGGPWHMAQRARAVNSGRRSKQARRRWGRAGRAAREGRARCCSGGRRARGPWCERLAAAPTGNAGGTRRVSAVPPEASGKGCAALRARTRWTKKPSVSFQRRFCRFFVPWSEWRRRLWVKKWFLRYPFSFFIN